MLGVNNIILDFLSKKIPEILLLHRCVSYESKEAYPLIFIRIYPFQ